MRSALAYSPGSSPLHRASPAAAIAFLGSFAVAAFLFASPLVLGGVGLAVCVAGSAAGAGRALASSLRWGLALSVLIVALNVLVNHRGDTVLVRGWEVPVLGPLDVTAESLAAGGALGARILVVLLAFAVYSTCVDPDGVLRLLRPLAHRSALTASLVGRMVPVAASDLTRLREAAGLRGPGAAPVGRAELLRRVLAGSLDRAVDVAATLELRGYGLDRPTHSPRARRSLDDGVLWGCALAALLASAAGLAAGVGGFETYPRIELDTGAATLALALALPIVAAVPFAADRVRARPRAGGRRLAPRGAGGGLA